jgi:hypothetical protein
MAIQLPQSRLNVRQVRNEKRNVPIDQIIAVEGQNPIANGIEVAASSIGKALEQRAALRRQGEQLAKLESLAGKPPGSFAGLDPSTAATITMNSMKTGKKKPLGEPFKGEDGSAYQYFYDENTQQTTAEPLPKGLPPAKPKSQETQVYIGNDANGNPLFAGNKSTKITVGSVPTGGSVLSKSQPTNIQKDINDIDIQIGQMKAIRSMLSDLPGGVVGGATSLASKATFGAIGGKQKEYNDMKPAVATKIYRAMTGDTRLSDADAAARAYPLLPSFAEPVEVREAKIANIEKNLSDRRESLLSGGGLKSITPKSPVPLVPRRIGRFSIEVEQ